MTKAKKIAIAVCVFVFAVSGLWSYWERQILVGDLIPEEIWTRLELRETTVAAAGSGEEIVYDAPLEPLLTQINATSVTRDEKNPYLDEPYFQIVLYNGQTYPTMLYVEHDGDIHVAVQLDFDHWKNYEDGGELYDFLLNYSESLPAEVQIPQ